MATLRKIQEAHPRLRLLLIEKEEELSAHQTGHNSGVIHSGLYYKPGSAKARTCVRGGQLLREFCQVEGIAYAICGKVVVATDPSEFPSLEELYRRGTANGVEGLSEIGPERLREIEPHASGLRALHVPRAGIVDYPGVVRRLGDLARTAGATIRLGTRLLRSWEEPAGLALETSRGEFHAKRLVSCAGLHCDRVARAAGTRPGVKIVPFRGEYYTLVPSSERLVRGLIYPVPDPRFPFLGVHFTRMVHGGVEAGPNAVLALKREGYQKSDFDWLDTFESLTFPGFWRMARKYWRTGLGEVWRSISKRAFVAALRRLVPEIREEDLVPGGAGVRAQALQPSGQLVDDFHIAEGPRALHVLNAPSPAATASLAIGEEIARRATECFDLDD